MLQDLRFALRTLAKSPGFTLVAVLTLALGIGASTAVYTALERVVLDPLPYPDAGRLVQLKSSVPRVGPGTEWDVSAGAWFFFGREAHTIDGLGAYSRGGANLVGPDGPERARTAQVSAHMLQLLGARAIRGRLIDERDDVPGGAQVAVVSHRFWQRRLGGDDRVIGTTISIYEQPMEIIGVMAPGVDLPPANGMPAALLETDVWLPLRLNPAGPFWNAHTQFRTIARLKEGVTLDAAQAEFARLTARLPEAVPTAYTRDGMQRSGFATRVYSLKTYVVREVSKTLWILFGAVGVVLLIVYANAANLFLVRAEARRREVVIRTALGADATAIARHFLAESLVLASAGGVLAMVLASWGVEALTHLAPDGVPRLQGLRPDGSVVLFALALVLVGAAVLAALPALRARRAVRAGELVQGDRGPTVGRESQRVRSGLVVAQVALALVLVVGAGLLVESMQRLRAVDLGIRPHGVLTAQLYLPYQRYDSHPKLWRFYSAALERVRAVPGVEAVGLTSDVPLEGGYGCTVQGFEDPAVRQRIADASGTLCAGQEPTSPGYFEAMGIPVLRGRALTQDDLEHPERGSVVVSKAFAERFWPGEDPIGKGVGPNGYTNQKFYRVVGVVGDVYAGSAGGARGLAVYYPVLRIPGTAGWWPNPMTLVVKTRFDDPVSLVPALQTAIRDVDPSIPVADVDAMETIVDRSMAQLSFAMVLLAIAASTALLLAAIGLYGVISYLVSRRTGEIGIRMALGAEPRQVARLVVGGSIKLALVGVSFGVVAALGFSRVLRGLLYDVQPTQPLAYLIAALVLGAVAALAAYLPARRASRVDPMIALRAE
ncbi:MAG TPA: ABC transporter permease [Gemmatimonadales bacterium]|jgi:predicted permease